MTSLSEMAEYVMPNVPAKTSDFALVFGTRHGVDAFASAISEIWSSGLTSTIVISGGHTEGGARTEAEVLCERAVALGVPHESMLLEPNARNTGENVLMTRELLRGHPRLSQAASVLAVGKICSIRRYLMTIARHMPHLSTSMYPVNYFDVEREKWYADSAFHARVVAEYKKIPAYLKAGYLTEITIGNPVENQAP